MMDPFDWNEPRIDLTATGRRINAEAQRIISYVCQQRAALIATTTQLQKCDVSIGAKLLPMIDLLRRVCQG